jgi:hypothetical protein
MWVRTPLDLLNWNADVAEEWKPVESEIDIAQPATPGLHLGCMEKEDVVPKDGAQITAIFYNVQSDLAKTVIKFHDLVEECTRKRST